MAYDGQWNADRLPWNRRKRRAIEKAKFVVVHLYSGDNEKTWKQLERQSNGVEVIQVELKKGADMRNNDLEELARAGRIDQVLAGPPCRTVSMCRFRSVAQADRGPQPLRGRCGQLRFGLPSLTHAKKNTVDNDTALWLRMLKLVKLTKDNNSKATVMVEQPQDPLDYRADDEELHKGYGFPTFLPTSRRSRWIREASGILQ